MPTNQQAREYYDKLKIHHSNLIETLKKLQTSSSLSIKSVQQFETFIEENPSKNFVPYNSFFFIFTNNLLTSIQRTIRDIKLLANQHYNHAHRFANSGNLL
jgi:hypothetical protein